MLASFKSYFLLLDLFAPSYEFYVHEKVTKYKTFVGAISTVFFLVTALCFGSLRFIMWSDGTL